MLSFITPDELIGFGKTYQETLREEKATASTGRPTFLSHSTQDDDLIPGAKLILEKHGALVYTDDEDESLPSNPTPETADILRKNIQRCPKFVLFVTKNGKDSNWIPWELGLADGIHHSPNVALFPSAENQFDQTWSEREYLGLYLRILWGNIDGYEKPLWMVINHRTMAATPLRKWINA
ncbi:MAG: hypothetical protein ACSHX4_14660 [Opitutaceae bacterium]